MKYKLLKDLPFLKADSILSYGTWTGGGLGVDMGETKYEGGGSSHNGVKTFDNWQNKMLESIFMDRDWIAQLPDTLDEALNLYDTKYFTKKELVYVIKKGHLTK